MSGFEILGAIAAVDAIIKEVNLVWKYVDDVKHYEEQQAELRQSLEEMKIRIKTLKDGRKEVESHPKKQKLFVDFLRVTKNGLLDSTGEAQDELEKKLRQRHGFDKAFNRTVWSVYKRKNVQSLRSRIEELSKQLETALKNDDRRVALDTNENVDAGRVENQTFFKAQTKRNQVVDIEKQFKEREQVTLDIARWLSKVDLEARHQELFEQSVDFGHNIFECDEFLHWREGRPWILSCWADAGAGKVSLIPLGCSHGFLDWQSGNYRRQICVLVVGSFYTQSFSDATADLAQCIDRRASTLILS